MKNLTEAAFHFDNSLKSNFFFFFFLLGFNPSLKVIKLTKQENHSLCLLDGTFKNHKNLVRNVKCYLGLTVTKNVH